MIEILFTLICFFVYSVLTVEYDESKHKKMFKNYKNMPKF